MHSGKDAEKADHSLRFGHDGKKKKAKDLTQDEAAAKIQRVWHGKAARMAVSRMKSWQSRWLTYLEGFPATIFCLALVAVDLVFSYALADAFPLATKVINYSSTGFFLRRALES